MLLGIDFGLKHIGLATSEGSFATPLSTLDVETSAEAVQKIQLKIGELGISKIIVGESEGKSREQAHQFGQQLGTMVQLPVEFVDETLSSNEAEQLHAGKPQTGSHAVAAAIILQRYLDSGT